MPFAESIVVKRDMKPPLILPLNQVDVMGEKSLMILPHLEHGLTLLWRLRLSPGKNRISFQAVNGAGVEGPPAVFELDLLPEE